MTSQILCTASATRLPWWAWGVGATGVDGMAHHRGHEGTRARPWLRGAALATLASGAGKSTHHRTPSLPHWGARRWTSWAIRSRHGGGGGPGSWPSVLSRRHRVDHDEPRPRRGDGRLGIAQADRVVHRAPVIVIVIVAIGGNDVLGGTDPASFERSLDALLARLRSADRTVVMLELPLPRQRLRRRPAPTGPPPRRPARAQGLLIDVLTSPGTSSTPSTSHVRPLAPGRRRRAHPAGVQLADPRRRRDVAESGVVVRHEGAEEPVPDDRVEAEIVVDVLVVLRRGRCSCRAAAGAARGHTRRGTARRRGGRASPTPG